VSLFYAPNRTIHSKAVIVDDLFASVGSANFADCSMTGVDTELAIGVATASPTTAAGGPAVPQDLRLRLWADLFGLADPTGASIASLSTNPVAQWQSLATGSSKVIQITS
jgi:phosphatidylserine/phosphatidylglycerophosphate/cardiolipin synthase-like enzyme